MRDINIAVNICTYHRNEFVEKNISKLLKSKFFEENEKKYYGRLQIFVVDNGCELKQHNDTFLHVFHNRNTGGSGGFQRGLEEIRKNSSTFSHVIFMDDDVEFDIEAFYILFDYLSKVSEKYIDNPVAGRMFCMDRPDIQYTAAEIWNRGNLKHVEYMKQITSENYMPGRVNYSSGAEYGGWWFCCFPMSFVKDNDIIPFFIHCDDVEYGLRCGKPPIIIEGVHVWHETFEKRMTPIIHYYDTRNPLFVNSLHSLNDNPKSVFIRWKDAITSHHIKNDYVTEYYVIRAMADFLKGMDWLKKIDPEKYHRRLGKMKGNKLKNAFAWRVVERKYKRRYEI